MCVPTGNIKWWRAHRFSRQSDSGSNASLPVTLNKVPYLLLLLLLFSHYVMSNSFVTSWTGAHQTPLSMGFSRQEYWSGLLFPSPGDLPNPGIEPASPAFAGRFFTTEPPQTSYSLSFFSYKMGLTATSQRRSLIEIKWDGAHGLLTYSSPFTFIQSWDPGTPWITVSKRSEVPRGSVRKGGQRLLGWQL